MAYWPQRENYDPRKRKLDPATWPGTTPQGPVSWNQMRNWGRYSGAYGLPGGVGQPGMGTGTPGLPITSEKWFPELYNLMFGRLQGGQRGLMNQITGNLGRTMGRHLSRTNVAVPVGADALARRYMSPLSQAMEAQDPMRMMGQAQQLARMFAPGFKAEWGERPALFQSQRDPTRYLEKYMNRYWGGR